MFFFFTSFCLTILLTFVYDFILNQNQNCDNEAV